jgi:hypothetical protein
MLGVLVMAPPKVTKPRTRKGSEAERAERFERQTGFRPEQKPRAYRAYQAQQQGEAPNGQQRDAQPQSAGPRGGSRVAVGRRPAARAAQGSKAFDRRVRSFLRLGTASPRRVLLLELTAVMVVVTIDQFSQGEVPTPQAYVAPFVVYLILGFMAELGGDGGARVATGLGALVLVALVLANAPGIVKALQVVSGQRPQAAPLEGVG